MGVEVLREQAAQIRGTTQERRFTPSQLDLFIRWFDRLILSAIDRGSLLDTVSYIYRYDRRTGRYNYFITRQELTYNFTVIGFSAIAFGAGIYQCITTFGG